MRFAEPTTSSLTALAILIGVLLVVVAVYISNTRALAEDSVTIQRASDDERRLYGNPKAPVVVVEFSDYQCPYCASLHPTLQRLVDESDGQVAWEYRHLPLDFHPLAEPAAIAAECVAKQLGNKSFLDFSAKLMGEQRSLSEKLIRDFAIEYGVTEEMQASCTTDSSIRQLIQSDVTAATVLGGSGTPFSVIILPNNTYRTVSGAVPYEEWKTIISPYVQ